MRLIFALLPLTLTAIFACGSSVSGGGGGAAGGTGGSTSSSSSSSSSSSTSTSTSSSSGGCVDPASPAAFEIGTGETCFERLTAGQEVPVMSGPQGGFHIWLAAGCSDCGGEVILQYGIKDVTTHDWITGTAANTAVMTLDPSGWNQVAGVQDRLPGVPWDPPSVLPKGTHVILSGAALDMNMNVVHQAEVEVVLGDQVAWNPPCSLDPGCGQPGGLPCCTDGVDGGGSL